MTFFLSEEKSFLSTSRDTWLCGADVHQPLSSPSGCVIDCSFFFVVVLFWLHPQSVEVPWARDGVQAAAAADTTAAATLDA